MVVIIGVLAKVQGVSCTTCTKIELMIMAYLYRKDRSPYWYIQYQDSNRKKHDQSTALTALVEFGVTIGIQSVGGLEQFHPRLDKLFDSVYMTLTNENSD
jgi:hypothetical protein